MRKIRNLVFQAVVLTLTCILLMDCGGYEKQLQNEREIYRTFGTRHNAIRRKVGIAILPKASWKGSRVVYNGVNARYGQCEFAPKKLTYEAHDSIPSWGKKEIHFITATRQPLREIDVYYSGRRYMEGDPDFFGWERVELAYDFVSDTLQGYIHPRSESHMNKYLKAGAKSAYLVTPVPETVSLQSGKEETWMTLKGREINRWQADSVLRAWGL